MNVDMDIFLKRGKNHQICEDHVLKIDSINAIVLSDGCTSSPWTDIGSRILTGAAHAYLLEYRLSQPADLDYWQAGRWIINRAYAIAELMGLSYYILDATLILAYQIKDDIYVHMYGDGYIFSVDWDGVLHELEISYEPNFPYYLSYLLNPARRRKYEMEGCKKYVTINGVRGGMNQYDVQSKYTYSLRKYQTILIASDGLGTFNFEATIVWDVARELTDVKPSNVKTRFLYRRANKVISQYEKKGFSHHDDIAIGGFRVRGDKDEILCQGKEIGEVGSK